MKNRIIEIIITLVIADCSYSLKSKANRDTKEGNHYKGAV